MTLGFVPALAVICSPEGEELAQGGEPLAPGQAVVDMVEMWTRALEGEAAGLFPWVGRPTFPDAPFHPPRPHTPMNLRSLLLPPVLLAFVLAACGDSPRMELDPDAAVDGQIPPPPSVEAPPADAERSESGLAWIVLEPGRDETFPTPDDRVRVHYSGWTTDGEMFDSSVMRGEPSDFPAGGLIQGWVEGLQLMSVGEKRRFWIPVELAYGDPPSRPGAPEGMLVFDVYLIEVLGR